MKEERTIADKRVASLNELGILDTPAEQKFDDIVFLATQLCQCEVSIIGFMTRDREWFKARIGIAELEAPLEDSVCRYVLTEPDFFEIPDMSIDERTARLVEGGPGFRFYAAAPIFDRHGTAIGSLCVVDKTPRPEGLAPYQRDALKALARQVMTLLEATRAYDLQEYSKDVAHAYTASKLTDERRVAEMREHFIAMLGHDLRNPLNAIVGGLQVLDFEQTSERGKNVLSMMRLSAQRMNELIENTLDFARTRMGGGISINNAHECEVAPFLEQVISELQSVWPGRDIQSHIDVKQPIRCDAPRLAQLFSNLLSNALKHGSAERPINVVAEIDNGEFRLSVTNGGRPIPPETIERLFQPYFQGDQKERSGLGLGLYIVAEIARAHNGTIEVASSNDETRFTFKMPLAA